MTLEEYLQTARQKLRKFELYALVQQNKGTYLLDQTQHDWQIDFELWKEDSNVGT